MSKIAARGLAKSCMNITWLVVWNSREGSNPVRGTAALAELRAVVITVVTLPWL